MGKGEVRGLIKFLGIGKKPSELASFNERLRVQKAVFLLKHMGVKPFTEYEFNMYIRGPYSPSLAKEYYALANVRTRPFHFEPQVASLLKWFAKKDPLSLEIASSILSIKDRYQSINKEGIYSTLLLSKPWVKREQFQSALSDLKSKGL